MLDWCVRGIGVLQDIAGSHLTFTRRKNTEVGGGVADQNFGNNF